MSPSYLETIMYLILIALLVLSDQLTKLFIYTNFTANESINILPFFNIVFVQNQGVSFGMLKSLGPLFLIVMTLSITVFLLLWLKRTNDKITKISLSFIIAGAVGNIIDRIVRGYVVDFLDFHIYNYHWPAFNVADISISCGVLLMIFQSLFSKKEYEKHAK